jgi:hypothetical protein
VHVEPCYYLECCTSTESGFSAAQPQAPLCNDKSQTCSSVLFVWCEVLFPSTLFGEFASAWARDGVDGTVFLDGGALRIITV